MPLRLEILSSMCIAIVSSVETKNTFHHLLKGVQLPKIASDIYSAALKPESKSKISYLSHKHKLWPALCGDNEYQ